MYILLCTVKWAKCRPRRILPKEPVPHIIRVVKLFTVLNIVDCLQHTEQSKLLQNGLMPFWNTVILQFLHLGCLLQFLLCLLSLLLLSVSFWLSSFWSWCRHLGSCQESGPDTDYWVAAQSGSDRGTWVSAQNLPYCISVPLPGKLRSVWFW